MFFTGRLNSIYKYIKVTYSIDALHQARRLERICLSQTRNQQHLRFLHLCKEQDRLPRFLLSPPPIDHPKAWNIPRKTGWSYLRVLISNCHHKLRNQETESIALVESLRMTDEICLSSLRRAIHTRRDYVQNDVAKRHDKKLQQSSVDHKKQDELKKKWIINASQRKLNDDEIGLLRKGLNFVKTPKTASKKEILASVERGISNLDENTQFEVRANTYSILKQAKPPAKQNLTRAELKAIQELKADNTMHYHYKS